MGCHECMELKAVTTKHTKSTKVWMCSGRILMSATGEHASTSFNKPRNHFVPFVSFVVILLLSSVFRGEPGISLSSSGSCLRPST